MLTITKPNQDNKAQTENKLIIDIESIDNWHENKTVLWTNQELIKQDTALNYQIFLGSIFLAEFTLKGKSDRDKLFEALLTAKQLNGTTFYLRIESSKWFYKWY